MANWTDEDMDELLDDLADFDQRGPAKVSIWCHQAYTLIWHFPSCFHKFPDEQHPKTYFDLTCFISTKYENKTLNSWH